MEIGPTILLPKHLQANVIAQIQGCQVARINPVELPPQIFWSRTFKRGQICSLVHEVTMRRGRGTSASHMTKFLYPVIAKETAGSKEVSFEIAYSFGIADVLEIMTRGGCVRRKKWHEGFDVRWIHDDNRSIVWYNTGDGYLPYLLSQEDCAAIDWGVVRGFDKERSIG